MDSTAVVAGKAADKVVEEPMLAAAVAGAHMWLPRAAVESAWLLPAAAAVSAWPLLQAAALSSALAAFGMPRPVRVLQFALQQ